MVRSPLVRRQTGYDLDLIVDDTEHISLGNEVLYRNPYPGRRWMDEEIAVATLLERMADWVQGMDRSRTRWPKGYTTSRSLWRSRSRRTPTAR